jgi:hypothetical protein
METARGWISGRVARFGAQIQRRRRACYLSNGRETNKRASIKLSRKVRANNATATNKDVGWAMMERQQSGVWVMRCDSISCRETAKHETATSDKINAFEARKDISLRAGWGILWGLGSEGRFPFDLCPTCFGQYKRAEWEGVRA